MAETYVVDRASTAKVGRRADRGLQSLVLRAFDGLEPDYTAYKMNEVGIVESFAPSRGVHGRSKQRDTGNWITGPCARTLTNGMRWHKGTW